MRKNFLVFLCLLLICSSGIQAQCPAGRYINEIFPAVTMDSVMYSSPYSLMMDIYQPAGDTLAARPLIILAHEGSFVYGTNREQDYTVLRLDSNFARRGYVTATIDYRLTNLITLTDSATAINEVIQAVSDGKAAIRYFMKDAATTNTYRIDTNNIYIGGNSAGAVLYMHVGYIDSLGACPPDIVTAMNANGGFEGNSGNAGYTTKCKAVVNLAGALNRLSFIGPGSVPSVNAQGTDDNVVPYECGDALEGICPVTLCGLGELEGVYDANDVYHMSLLFPGAGHVPWDADTSNFNSVDSIVTVFLYNMVCTGVAEVNGVSAAPELRLFPNPAGEIVNIQCGQALGDIAMFDQTGRMVFSATAVTKDQYEINTSGLSRGLYFIRVSFTDGNNIPVVRKVVVE